MKLYKTPEGYFDFASMFNSEPVPMLDDQGQPVIGASGKPVMIPKLADLHFFVDMGNEVGPDALLPLFLDLRKFRQYGTWDLQRNPENTPELVDGATIAIGLYGAAAGIPEDDLLKIQNQYANNHSTFKGAIMD
jgi:hypothetical protein